jgi:hypothetical protein
MEGRIPLGILGLFRWVARDSDLVISSIARLVGRGRGCSVIRFLAEDKNRNLDLEFLKLFGEQAQPTADCLTSKPLTTVRIIS